jgi:hypothetical protein
MDARQLFKSYRLSEAVTAYARQLEQNIGSGWTNKDGLGKALMAAGSYRDAIPYLETVGTNQRSEVPMNLESRIGAHAASSMSKHVTLPS